VHLGVHHRELVRSVDVFIREEVRIFYLAPVVNRELRSSLIQ
jgi:hypothetical protein